MEEVCELLNGEYSPFQIQIAAELLKKMRRPKWKIYCFEDHHFGCHSLGDDDYAITVTMPKSLVTYTFGFGDPKTTCLFQDLTSPCSEKHMLTWQF